MRSKSACLCICIAWTLLSFFSASAAGTTTYSLYELELSVSLSSDYVVFTRDIKADDPNLSAYGLTKQGLSSLMSSQNIYLDAWDKKVSHEIKVTMIASSVGDFNQYSDTALLTMATSLESEYASHGVTYIKSELYHHKQAKFLKIYSNQLNGKSTTYGLQYYTVYGNKAINVTMQSYSGSIDTKGEAILRSIVDSVNFNSKPQATPPTKAYSQPFEYTDAQTHTSFTVPANWASRALTEKREYIDAKFISGLDQAMCIMYGSTDAWSATSESERAGKSRKDMNNSIFSIEDVAQMYGVPKSQVKTVTYGGYDYYSAVVTSTNTSYGIDLKITMTLLSRIDNGYLYLFQFSGTSTSPYYADFESLLKSVRYPNTIAGPANTQSNAVASGGFDAGNLLLNLLITIAVYSLPIIVYRYAIRKSPLSPKMAMRIALVYGIAAFFAMAALIFALHGSGVTCGAIVLWSYINYKVLTGGKSASAPVTASSAIIKDPVPNQEEEATASAAPAFDDPTIQSNAVKCENDFRAAAIAASKEPCDPSNERYCHRCGQRLPKESAYCHKCGAAQ